MCRTFAVIFFMLMASPSSFAQSTIADCKSGTFHNCESDVTQWPYQGAWVKFRYTSCADSTTKEKTVTVYDTSCMQYWFDCLTYGYDKEFVNPCSGNCYTVTYLCNACA
jgi:hypothetical protein